MVYVDANTSSFFENRAKVLSPIYYSSEPSLFVDNLTNPLNISSYPGYKTAFCIQNPIEYSTNYDLS